MLSIDENAQRSSLVTTPNLTSLVLCRNHRDTVETHDESIREIHVNESTPTLTAKNAECFKPCGAKSAFNPSPQTAAGTSSTTIPLVSSKSSSCSSVDTNKIPADPCSVIQMTITQLSADTTDYAETGVSGTDRKRTSKQPSLDLSTGSNTSKLLGEYHRIPPNADDR